MHELALLVIVIQSDHVHAVGFLQRKVLKKAETVFIFKWIGTILPLLKLTTIQWLQSCCFLFYFYL